MVEEYLLVLVEGSGVGIIEFRDTVPAGKCKTGDT